MRLHSKECSDTHQRRDKGLQRLVQQAAHQIGEEAGEGKDRQKLAGKLSKPRTRHKKELSSSARLKTELPCRGAPSPSLMLRDAASTELPQASAGITDALDCAV